MTCTKCSTILRTLNLKNEEIETISFDAWIAARHEDLISYASHNNGVSEGGNGIVCTTCFSFFQLHHHIFMAEDTVGIERMDEPEEAQIESVARFLYQTHRANELKKVAKQTNTRRVYTTVDSTMPIVFHHEKASEIAYTDFELHQQFGHNHATYSLISSLHLSLEDCIRSLGTREDYLKKLVFLTFELPTDAIDIVPFSSPYADASVRISTEDFVPPEDLFVFDITTNQTIPLTAFSLAKNHNHLTVLQEKIRKLPVVDSTEKEAFIEKMIATIIEKRA